MTIALNTHNKQLERKATTMTHAQNTVANQYLNSILRVGAKPLMIISILLTAMFILAACGGGAAAPAAVTPTVDPCDGNPFGSTCTTAEHAAARTTVVQTCLAAGAANTATCADAIVAEPCIVNPQADACATDTDFIAYLPTGQTIETVRNTRQTFCERPENRNTAAICGGVLANCNAANPFANDLCDTATGIMPLRITYCTNAATTWNDNCDAEGTYTGTAAARDTACRAFGTGAGGDADCHDRADLLTACAVTDPFAVAGCDSADGIAALRTTYCTTGNTIFDLECGALDADTTEIITGTHAARNTACETSGTDAGVGNDCATRANIMTTCTEANPFAVTGCNTATKITPEFRTAFCVKTDENDGKNPFTVGCPSSQTLDPALNTARDTACAENGITADTTCATRQNIIDTCTADNPFANRGCDDATHILAGDNAIRKAYCTTGKSIFHPMCEDSTHGEVNTARTNLVAQCMETPGSYFCTTISVDAGNGPTVAMCNATPFLTGCATIPEFNAGRMSVCTTDATSFTAGCNNAEYAGTDDAQASFAEDCAASTATGCDTTYINGGSDGPTVDTCNTTPFLAGCDTNSAFAEGRMSICTTEATLFNPGCTNDNYATSGDARTALIAECAGVSPPTKCTTIFANGVDGTTLDTCVADPFHTDCGASIVDDTFAAARTERTALCVATNDPFNTACEIANFADNNDAERDTYCQNTALPAAGATDGHCEDRKTEICVTTTATATYNPFAPLCRDDSGIAGLRDTFCNLGEQSANTNCETDAAVLCAANPFGTKLGTAATVDCTTGNTYDGNRKALVDACRNGDTLPSGATCTVAINNCNANPFNPTAFSGSVCDAAAFADAQVAYCVKPENAWHADCDALDVNTETVQQARGGVCVNNLAITGATANNVAAGMSLFHADCAGETDSNGLTVADARIAYCAQPDNTWQDNCTQFVGSEATVQQARYDICLDNGAIVKGATGGAGDVAAGASLFHADCTGATATEGETTKTIATERLVYCKNTANAWNANCDSYDTSGTDENADVVQARDTICLNNGAILKGAAGGAGDVAAGQSLFHGDCTGSTLTVGETTRTIATEQLAHCKEPANAWQDNCNEFDTGGGTVDTEVVQARDTICLNNGAILKGAAGGAGDVAAGQSLFHGDCTGSTLTVGETTRTIATEQLAFCTVGDDIFDTRCGTLDRATEVVAGTNAARLLACQNSLVSLGPKAPVNACVAESTMICGTPGAPGSAPFSAICELDARNTNFAEIVATQQEFCRDSGNNAMGFCTDTIVATCGTKAEPLDTTVGVFDGLCLGDEYLAAQRTYCIVTAVVDDASCRDNMQNSLSVRDVVCNGDDVADDPYAAVCGDSNLAGRIAFCRLEHSEDPDGCSGTRDIACIANGGDPFDALLCMEDGNGYDAERQAACEQNTTLHSSVGTNNCMDRADLICGTATIEGINPFAAICSVDTQNVNNHADYVAAQTFYCLAAQGNLSDSECPNVTSGDWLDSFTGDDALKVDPTGDGDTTTRNNEFLAITNDDGNGQTISTEGTTTEQDGSDAPTPTTLDFTAIQYDEEQLNNLSADDGLAFFIGFHSDDTEASAYAGIYETTDLGELITDNELNVTWHGALRILDAGVVVNAAIALDVTFDGTAGEINGFLTNINGTSGLKDFYIDADFSNEGVITTSSSDIYYGDLSDDPSTFAAKNGQLSGIIGQDGAIGVFISNDAEADVYTGGFVVSGICSVDIFAAGCDIADDTNGSQTAFCLNATDNGGRNPFNLGCGAADGTEVITGTNALRKAACETSLTVNGAGGCADTVLLVCGPVGTSDKGILLLSETLCAGDNAYLGDRQNHCADNIGDTGCPAVLTTLCTGANSISATVNAGGVNYSCLGDANQLNSRRAYCTTATTTGTCPSVLATLCTGANSLLASVDAGGVNYNCLADTAQLDSRRNHCAGNISATGCPAVLSTLCTGANSLLASVDAGGVNYNCLADTAQLDSRRNHCAGNISATGCPAVLSTLCTGANSLLASVDAGGVNYNCLGDTAQLDSRRNHCAGNISATGCPAVLSTLCTGANSLLASVDAGGVNYNCLADTAQLDSRRNHCAGNISATGCPAVLSTLCTGANSLLASVDAGGVNYNCLGDTAQLDSRRNHCAGNISATGCPAVLSTLCTGANSISATVDAGGVNYNCLADTAQLNPRRAYCTTATTTGDCPNVLSTLCTGANSLLATVDAGGVNYNCLGDTAQLDSRRNHCAGNISATGCPAVLSTLCTGANSLLATVDAGGVNYNCLGDTAQLDSRRNHCAGNISATGCPAVLSTLCTGANSISATVDAGGVNYNCLTDTAQLNSRRAYCTTATTTGDCPNVLATLCTGANALSTSVDAGGVNYNCLGDNAQLDSQRNHCAGNISDTGCPDILSTLCTGANSISATVDAGGVNYNCLGDANQLNSRRAYCTTATTTGTCPSVLATLCTGANSISATVDAGGVNYNCLGDTAQLNSRRAYCTTATTTGDCPNVLATLCTGANSISATADAGGVDYSCLGDANQLNSRRAYCTTATTTGTCPSVLATLCTGANSISATADAGGVDYSCLGDANQLNSRRAYCTTATTTGTCPSVLATLCTGANSISATVDAGGVNYNCLGDTAQLNSRRAYCTTATTTGTCPSVLATLCTGANSISATADAGGVDYSCLGDANQLNSRRAYCTTATTTGTCPSVLATLCTGANSISATVNAGGVNYNCLTDTAQLNSRRAYCTTATTTGDCPNVLSTLCTGVNSLLATVNAGGVNYNCLNVTAYNSARETACSTFGAGFGTTPQCASTVARLCNDNVGVFNAVCSRSDVTATYEPTRLGLCVDVDEAALGARPSECGLENTSSRAGTGYFNAYCRTPAGKTNARDCPDRYSFAELPLGLNIDVSVSSSLGDLGIKALNSRGTGLLGTPTLGSFWALGTTSVVAHPATNFIVGDAATLNLVPGAGSTQDATTLTLDNVNTGDSVPAQQAHGFAFGRVNFGTDNDRLYVGLLSGTSLGAPIATGFTTATWNGKLRGIYDTTLVTEQDLSLQVIFGGTTATNTIKTTGTLPTFGDGGDVMIDGKFTRQGLIYGNVGLSSSNTLDGTLTGLIGQNGAVGIFKSNAPTSDQKPYVGGFVANPNANTAPPLNCGEVEDENELAPDPFNADCTEDKDEELQVRLCVNNDPLAIAGNGFSANCELNDRVTNRVCTGSGKEANPFDTLCKDANIDTLTEKKNPLFRTAATVKTL